MTEDYSRSPNPHRLYRNKRTGVLGGVCAGLADYFNADVTLVRIVTILLLIFMFPPTSVAYIVAWIVMPARPERFSAHGRPATDEDAFWRGVERRPEATFSNLKYRFRDLDERLQDSERVVTSDEWKLRRQFREIE